ncbi:carbonic anhydrase [Bifidobacterium tsurumiense]|uniref:carbonic anhydrase n=1 Tax=Bifidobacterium tsurumiense TaxID=356829 RepID=UPI0012B2E0C5|nr:carbonic anhydrase [Bifidobacterium tsurumiense]MSS12654.1 carbonic anhydrase [Bifidobacterium tsurumiense]
MDNTQASEDREDFSSSTANATWSRLLAGNRRFVEGKAQHPWQDKETRDSLIERQNPDAAILSCSDSRVPPEIIFDAGLGDIFAVRTAGQMIDDAVLSSLEYAADDLHVSLLIVMGHEGCGAIKAAIQAFEQLGPQGIAESDSYILHAVSPSVIQAHEAELEDSADIERVHIARTIERLVERSSVIQEALSEERLMIVGARYELATGKVEVLSF